MSANERPFANTYPLAFLARVALFSALSCLLGLLILRWVFWQDLGSEYAPAFYMIKNLLAFLIPALVFCVLAVLLVASVAVFLVAMFVSHRIAGPLFRLQRVAGYLQRRILIGHIHLRTADQGKSVARVINEWVAVYKQKTDRLHEVGRLAAAVLAAAEDDAASGDTRTRDAAGAFLAFCGDPEGKRS